MPIVSRRVSIPAFHALFDRWSDLLDGYDRVTGTGESRDVAYWHYENTLTGLLATAAWQTRGAGLVQFSTGRHYGKKPEDSGSGSGDAWLLVGGIWYAVEAKICWSRSSVEGLR